MGGGAAEPAFPWSPAAAEQRLRRRRWDGAGWRNGGTGMGWGKRGREGLRLGGREGRGWAGPVGVPGEGGRERGTFCRVIILLEGSGGGGGARKGGKGMREWKVGATTEQQRRLSGGVGEGGREGAGRRGEGGGEGGKGTKQPSQPSTPGPHRRRAAAVAACGGVDGAAAAAAASAAATEQPITAQPDAPCRCVRRRFSRANARASKQASRQAGKQASKR